MFHFKDGWFFSRLPNGSVRIEKRISAKMESPIEESVEIDPDSWVSIVASVSIKGETPSARLLARDLHEYGSVLKG